LDEFFRIAFQEKIVETVEEFQTYLDAWSVHSSTERPHQGYRNMGRRPIDTIFSFSGKDVREDA